MSDAADKRFDATPARRARARRDGNVARSSELSGSASFAAGLLALGAMLPIVSGGAAAALRATAVAPWRIDVAASMLVVAAACVPAVAAGVAGIGATLAQGGGLHVAPLRFAPSKLAPLPGLKRMLGREAAVGAARGTAALVVTLAVAAPVAAHVLAVALRAVSPADAARAARDAAFAASAAACATGALFAGADYALAVRRWLHGLKMSFDEVKRDLKDQDGDPHARSRRRQLHRSLARGGIARTRDASFVVVNPTHVAVAVRYRPPEIPVPEILVRATGDAARRVRAIAEREAIPLVENVALARWLFRTGEAGRPIPAETYVAVAYVVAALVQAGLLDA